MADILFDERYQSHTNFESQNHTNFLMLVAFGTLAMYVDEYDDPITRLPVGLRYRSVPPGQFYLKENHLNPSEKLRRLAELADMPMKVDRLVGPKIVRAGGRNRHERRANEARRRRGLPMTAPVEVLYDG